MDETGEQGRYRHFKGGEYRMRFFARDAESEALAVVHKAMYGNHGRCICTVTDLPANLGREGHNGPRPVPTGNGNQ